MKQVFSIHLDDSSRTPLYTQISGQIRHAVANGRIQPGDRLPTVRELAKSLGVNPGTVFRAYRELEQEGIVASRRGGGTTVVGSSESPALIALRQKRLSNMVSDHILRVLSLGYSPEELEAESSLHLSRWREERQSIKAPHEAVVKNLTGRGKRIVIVASHDLALNLMIDRLQNQHPETVIEVAYAGSLGGLIALQEGRADLAGIHLLDEETGEYNYPYLKHLLPGRELAIVHLAYRVQGLMFARNNPRHIAGIPDLKRNDIRIINRQRGSGTRVLLDSELRKSGIKPTEVRGYECEVDTHSAVALNIAKGEADVGLGIQAAAWGSDLDFLPLFRERYDLVMPLGKYRSRLMAPLLRMVKSAEFKEVVAKAGGYDTSQTGSTAFFPPDK